MIFCSTQLSILPAPFTFLDDATRAPPADALSAMARSRWPQMAAL